MKLEVVNDVAGRAWYGGGLEFTCTQCGNCCTGGPGFVWITKEEIVRLAEHLKITPEETVEQYCRKIDGKFSLKEQRNGDQFDCIFLRESAGAAPASNASEARKGQAGRATTEPPDTPKRSCAIYPARPLQCRTWPFWPENLRSKENWNRAGRRCHGINQGRRFTLQQIHAVRDAADWPKDPPSSAKP